MTSSQITYDAIMALKNSTFHHECFISVIQDATIPTISSTSQPSKSSTNSPIIYCNFIFPIGLNAAVEIKDIHCSQFTQVASNTTIYNEGEATAILKPTISQEEKKSGTFFTHEYCARIDILYDRDGDGMAESVLYNRFMIPITYRYEKGDSSNNDDAVIVSASVVDGKEPQSVDTRTVVSGVVVGSLITLFLVLLIRRFKRYRSNRRKDEQVNVEVTPVPKGLLI
eukprot:scaffold11481_cov118-Skeletonema_dohrnii-CCMP3373.AAC.2